MSDSTVLSQSYVALASLVKAYLAATSSHFSTSSIASDVSRYSSRTYVSVETI
jgi:hypothetical protein